MMMLASPISSRPIRWCTRDARIRPGLPRFVDDAIQGADGQRLVRLVLEEFDAATLVVIADQSDERRDGAVAGAGLRELIDERLQIENLAGDRHERDRHTFSIATARALAPPCRPYCQLRERSLRYQGSLPPTAFDRVRAGLKSRRRLARATRFCVARLDPLHEEPVERVLGDDQAEGTHRGDHMVHPPRRLRAHTDVADRGFAQRAEFELHAVDRRPCRGLRACRPVTAAQADLGRGFRIVIEPDISGRRSVNRMADVVHPPRIGVFPLVRDAQRAPVVGPERTAKLAPCLFLRRDANGVLDQEQLHRIAERTEHINAFLV